MSRLLVYIVTDAEGPSPSAGERHAADLAAMWANEALARHGGRSLHQVLRAKWLVINSLIDRRRKPSADSHPAYQRQDGDVVLAFVKGTMPGGSGAYVGNGGYAAVSFGVLEGALRYDQARDDEQRHMIRRDVERLIVHELAHAAYGLKHPVLRSELRDDSVRHLITAYMSRATYRALPDGEGFSTSERGKIAQLDYLKVAEYIPTIAAQVTEEAAQRMVDALVLLPPTPPKLMPAEVRSELEYVLATLISARRSTFGAETRLQDLLENTS